MTLVRLARFALCGMALCAVMLALPASAQTKPENDAWGFADDEVAEPTLLELAQQQAVDVGMFVAFVVLAMVSFFRKSERLKYITLVVAVLYLGVYKSQLISIVNVFGLLTANLPVFSYNLAWYSFAIFTVASTILWGRLYCGRVCAFGALTQLLDRVVPAKLRVEIPARIEQRAAYIKYGLLAGAIAYFLATREITFYRYIEPFWMFTFQASVPLWIALGVLLVATVFIRNLYCRFLCPVGAALGLLSGLTVFKIKRWSECNTCLICEKTCEWGAIRGPKIIKSECVRCDDCERLYADKKRCPHWIIIQRKADVLARQRSVKA
ncbi:MAG TPA: 4Fe-4S binding protein [Vicinamibacterales bacterium]